MLEAHDIVKLKPGCLQATQLPDWLTNRELFYATVRRAVVASSQVPIGLRGPNRSQRFGLIIGLDDVEQIIKPYDLCTNLSFRHHEVQAYPAYQKFLDAQNIFAKTAIKWGVGGSLAYELASNEPTIKLTSDFDLLIYCQTLNDFPLTLINTYSAFFNDLDTQVITPKGGFALKEYLRTPNKKILLKTIQGPLLTTEIWN